MIQKLKRVSRFCLQGGIIKKKFFYFTIIVVIYNLLFWPLLIYRCLDDNDDEVRDRAILFLKLMDDEESAEKYVKDG